VSGCRAAAARAGRGQRSLHCCDDTTRHAIARSGCRWRLVLPARVPRLHLPSHRAAAHRYLSAAHLLQQVVAQGPWHSRGVSGVSSAAARCGSLLRWVLGWRRQRARSPPMSRRCHRPRAARRQAQQRRLVSCPSLTSARSLAPRAATPPSPTPMPSTARLPRPLPLLDARSSCPPVGL
jgi:hypothetical protein